MPIVSATITVDFTANYAGDHRVCWRIQGSGDPYDCSTIVNCVGGGTACQAIINADVNTTSCDGTVTFEGYVQAACEDVLSTNGRLPWTVDFVPTVTCQRTEILCDHGPVLSVTPLTGGSGYTLPDTVVITRDPSDTETSDATMSINTIGDGVINSITGLLSGGTGYIAAEVLTINGTTGAGATITIDSVDGGGAITAFTLTTNGSAYIGPFTFTGGSGTGADFDIVQGVDYDADGEILSITVTVPGSYQIPPTVTITSATGAGATFQVALAPCPPYTPVGTDCDSNSVDLPSGLQVGDTLAVCLDGGFNPAPDEYIITETGCCIPDDTASTACVDYHIENNTGIAQNVNYTECEGTFTTINVPDATTVAVCAIVDGVEDPNIPDLTITNTGDPCTL